jgi:DNA-binding transcriptional MerR regulator
MAKTIALKDLKTNLFVRSRLDQDWAIHLGELLDAGEKLKPIEINQENVVIDGRHRIEAHELNNLTEIEYTVTHTKDENDLIARAYRANLGGSLPPRAEDTEHTIRLLLQREEPIKTIAEMLGLPPSITRRYAAIVRSKDERAKVHRAVMAVTEGGLNAAQAAEQHGADVEKVREALGGKSKKHKRGIEEMQRALTQQFKSNSQKIAALMRSVFEKYEDGDVSARHVGDIIDHIDNLLKRSNRNLADWKKRFAASNGKTGKSHAKAA